MDLIDKLGLFTLTVFLGICIGALMCNTLGNTTITTSELDSVCENMYGENTKYLDTRIGTEDEFKCVTIIEDKIISLTNRG